MKVLVATEKPFAKAAVDGIRQIVEAAGFELALLEKYTDVNDFYKAVADADALIVRSDKVTKEVIDHAKNLKIVVRAGAGFDNLDLAACTERKIVAMNTPGQNSNAVAELAAGLMVYMNRNLFNPGTGSELKGKKLGIHAYGNVGRNVARVAKGLGMDIYAFDAFCPKEVIEKDGVKAVASVEELYSTCHVVSLHIPATKETIDSINYDLVNRMPKGAMLVNTARKEVIHEADMVRLLVLVSIVDVLCRIMVLDDLILGYAHSCFLDCHFGKRNSLSVCCCGSCLENSVYLFLCVGSKLFLCSLYLGNFCFKCLNAVNNCRYCGLFFHVGTLRFFSFLRLKPLIGGCEIFLGIPFANFPIIRDYSSLLKF